MSKFASTSSLLLSIVLIVLGALVPRVEFLGFLSGFAHILYIAGIVLFAIFLIATVGFKRFFALILSFIIIYAAELAFSFLFGLLGLGGILFSIISFVLAVVITLPIIRKLF